ncbi:MAG: hypothetical protein L3J13_04765 [Devosiaceae bacterium]|nr:hypothetical protein [Devosiaceae bacterium]
MINNRTIGANFNRSGNPVVTKAEMDARINARPKPVAQRHLTPNGYTQTSIRKSHDVQNEARIAQIRILLTSASDRLNTARNKAIVRGTARGDFGRSR